MFIRFNVFRSSGFIPKRMLETSISEQIARNLKSNLNSLADLLKGIKSSRPLNPTVARRSLRLGVRNGREFILSQIEIFEKVKENGDPKAYGERKRKMHYGLKKVVEISKSLVIGNCATGDDMSFWEIVQEIEKFSFSM